MATSTITRYALKSELDLLSGKMAKVFSTSVQNITFSVPASTRHFIIVSCGNSADRTCVLIADAPSGGANRFLTVAKSSGVTVSASGTSITVNIGSSASGYVYDQLIDGTNYITGL